MAAWKRKGGLDKFHDKLVNGMVAKEYKAEFAEAIFKQILGFGDTAFPKATPRASHIWSTSRRGSNATTRRRSPARC